MLSKSILKLLLRKLSIGVFVFICFSLFSADTQAANYLIKQLANTNDYNHNNYPQIDNGQVVWEGDDGNDYEVFLYDGKQTIQLTNNNYDDRYPQIDNGQVVWKGYDAYNYEIFLYDGKQTIQLTNNNVKDDNPQISNGQVVWQEAVGHNYEIFLYDGKQTIQLTNNNYNDFWPQIDNGQVVWQGDAGDDSVDEVYLYDGKQTIQLTNNNYNDFWPQIDNGQVVWQGDAGGDDEIYLYDGKQTIQLTNSNYDDHSPQISNGQVVWQGGNGGEVYLYDGKQTIQLTNNNYYDAYPQIDNGQVVWQWVDSWWEISLALPNNSPIAKIDSISPSPAVFKQLATFKGSGTDSEGTIKGYNWRSSLDGKLSDQASFTSSKLSAGTHTIYFKVQDNDDLWSEEISYTLVVQQSGKPTANLILISPNPCLKDQPVTFQGAGIDYDGIVVGYDWSSSKDGQLSRQALFTSSKLSEGIHFIYFSVQDNEGFWSDTISQALTVRLPVKPNASIDSIGPNPASTGNQVTFKGSGIDSDGTIKGYNWRSSVDGQLSEQVSFTNSKLSSGTHTIYFKVKDDDGLWSDEVSKQLVVRLENPSQDTQQGKNPYDDQNTVGEPVNIVTGNVYATIEDLSIPGRGIPFNFSRTYNSHRPYDGHLGYGWTYSYGDLLEDLGDKVKITQADGRAIYFTKGTDGSFKPQKGEYSALTKEQAGFICRLKNGTTYCFDLTGKLTSIVDRNYNQITLAYSPAGLLSKITDTVGREITFTYNSSNRLVQITDPAGRTVKYEYDDAGNFIRGTDLMGNVTAYEYDGFHNLTKVTYPDGNALFYVYDINDRCTSTYYSNNILKLDIVYEPDNHKTIITDSKGRQSVKIYNDLGLVTEAKDSDGYTTYYTWDENFNRTSVKDKNGNLTQMGYDSQGNLVSITSAQNNTSSFEYEPSYNFIFKSTDPLGNTTTYGYDNGNLVVLTNALGEETTYFYDTYGQLMRVSDANFHITAYDYDSYGNLITTCDTLYNKTQFTYDLIGNRTSVTDAKGNTTTYVYDQAGKVTKITYPDSTFAQFSYDYAGRRKSAIDPYDNTTIWEYTPADKISKTKDGLNREITYAYDTEGNLLKLTDSQGNITEYAYDVMNRVIEEKKPLGISTKYAYDKAGNKVSVTGGNGKVISYEYDSLNRLKKVIYPDNKTIIYTYDKLGRQSAIEDTQGKAQYSYDKLGRLIQIDGPKEKDSILYEYDKAGNRAKMIDQDGGITLYEYDPLNRLIRIEDANHKITEYEYDKLSNLILTRYPNGLKAQYSYDNMQRLTEFVNKNSADENISSYSYEYDVAGRRIGVKLAGGLINYIYDNANQLIREQRISPAVSYDISYSYDLNGNRKQMVKDGVMTDYQYNSFNQLIQQTNSAYQGKRKVLIKGQAGDINLDKVLVNNIPAVISNGIFSANVLLEQGSNTVTAQAIDKAKNITTQTLQINLDPTAEAAYTYDNNANLIQKSFRGRHTLYNYDYDNMLSKIIYSDGTTAKYNYDVSGRRIKEEKTMDNGLWTMDYLYDGNSVIIERDDSGKTTAAYTRGLSYGGGIGSIISKREGSNDYYYLYDSQGNVTHLTDSAGRVIMRYEYDSFGNVVYKQGSLKQSYQYQTKETDEQSGLVYFGARYYDPSIGRFTTADPLGIAEGPNRYVYLNNDPVNLVDLWGLCPNEPGLIDMSWQIDLAVGGTILGPRLLVAVLYGGESTVVYSGIGQRALAAASSGIPIFKTILGKRMEWIENSFNFEFPRIVWDVASRIYVSTAKGTVQAFVAGSEYDSTFARIEAPILEALEKLGRAIINYN